MATATSNLVHDNSTLANFQAWAQFIFNAFNTTAGWTQTTDTGQTAPSAAASVGTFYFIFKMSDALQTSCPTFVKITYGTNGTTVQLTVQVGQGSNGSGTLTGAVSNVVGNTITTNESITTYPCYASGDSGSIRIFMWQSASQDTGFLFGIERSKNNSGGNTAGYVTFISGGATGASPAQWAFLHLLAGIPNASPNYTGSNGWFITGNPNVSLNYNGTTAAMPFIPFVGFPDNPMLDWCCAAFQDVTEGATNITVSMYGANHNFVTSKRTDLSRVMSINGNVAIMMRYE